MKIELQTVIDVIEASINEHKRIRASVAHYNPDVVLALEIALHDIKEAVQRPAPSAEPEAVDPTANWVKVPGGWNRRDVSGEGGGT